MSGSPGRRSGSGAQRHLHGFDLLRIAAATGVIVSHSYYLVGRAEPAPLSWPHDSVTLGHLSVDVFFITSGYLVSMSWDRDPRAWAYAVRRFSRIWPGLIVMLALLVGVVGSATSTLGVSRYFADPRTAEYAVGNALVYPVRYVLPDVFAKNPQVGANGSLWTLRIEVTAYVLLALLGVFAWLSRRWVAPCLAVSGGLVAWVVAMRTSHPVYVASFNVHDTFDLLAMFAAGAAMRRVPTRSGWAVAALAVLLATRWFPVSFAQYALLPYVTVHLGRRQWRVAAAIRRLGDPSYGMYIYAFPIQQLIVLGLPGVSAPLLAAAAVPAAAAAGYASWHLIEARCLRAGRNFIHRRTDRLRVGVAPVPNA